MYDLKLDPPATIFGEKFSRFSEATYHVRQYAINASDDEARELVRDARDAETIWDAKLAAERMQMWIKQKRLDDA
jgi:hypothetical protein